MAAPDGQRVCLSGCMAVLADLSSPFSEPIAPDTAITHIPRLNTGRGMCVGQQVCAKLNIDSLASRSSADDALEGRRHGGRERTAFNNQLSGTLPVDPLGVNDMEI